MIPTAVASDYDLVVIAAPLWTTYLAVPARSFLADRTLVPGRVALLLTQLDSPPDRAFGMMEAHLGRPAEAKLALRQTDIKSEFASAALEAFAEDLKHKRAAQSAQCRANLISVHDCIAPNRRRSAMKRIRVAVIGFGRLRRACAEAILASEDLELAGIARHPEHALSPLPEMLGDTPVRAHWTEIPRIDLAPICLPPDLIVPTAHEPFSTANLSWNAQHWKATHCSGMSPD